MFTLRGIDERRLPPRTACTGTPIWWARTSHIACSRADIAIAEQECGLSPTVAFKRSTGDPIEAMSSPASTP